MRHLRIEWLRTEANSLLKPPAAEPALPNPRLGTSTDSTLDILDLNDIPESEPAEEAALCANCVTPQPANVQLHCGHWLCASCTSCTWQVYSATGVQKIRYRAGSGLCPRALVKGNQAHPLHTLPGPLDHLWT